MTQIRTLHKRKRNRKYSARTRTLARHPRRYKTVSRRGGTRNQPPPPDAANAGTLSECIRQRYFSELGHEPPPYTPFGCIISRLFGSSAALERTLDDARKKIEEISNTFDSSTQMQSDEETKEVITMLYEFADYVDDNFDRYRSLENDPNKNKDKILHIIYENELAGDLFDLYKICKFGESLWQHLSASRPSAPPGQRRREKEKKRQERERLRKEEERRKQEEARIQWLLAEEEKERSEYGSAPATADLRTAQQRKILATAQPSHPTFTNKDRVAEIEETIRPKQADESGSGGKHLPPNINNKIIKKTDFMRKVMKGIKKMSGLQENMTIHAKKAYQTIFYGQHCCDTLFMQDMDLLDIRRMIGLKGRDINDTSLAALTYTYCNGLVAAQAQEYENFDGYSEYLKNTYAYLKILFPDLPLGFIETMSVEEIIRDMDDSAYRDGFGWGILMNFTGGLKDSVGSGGAPGRLQVNFEYPVSTQNTWETRWDAEKIHQQPPYRLKTAFPSIMAVCRKTKYGEKFHYNADMVNENKNTLYVLSDNKRRTDTGGQFGFSDSRGIQQRSDSNIFGLILGSNSSNMRPPKPKNGDPGNVFEKTVFDESVKRLITKVDEEGWTAVVFPAGGLGTGIFNMPQFDPEAYDYVCTVIENTFGIKYVRPLPGKPRGRFPSKPTNRKTEKELLLQRDLLTHDLMELNLHPDNNFNHWEIGLSKNEGGGDSGQKVSVLKGKMTGEIRDKITKWLDSEVGIGRNTGDPKTDRGWGEDQINEIISFVVWKGRDFASNADAEEMYREYIEDRIKRDDLVASDPQTTTPRPEQASEGVDEAEEVSAGAVDTEEVVVPEEGPKPSQDPQEDEGGDEKPSEDADFKPHLPHWDMNENEDLVKLLAFSNIFGEDPQRLSLAARPALLRLIRGWQLRANAEFIDDNGKPTFDDTGILNPAYSNDWREMMYTKIKEKTKMDPREHWEDLDPEKQEHWEKLFRRSEEEEEEDEDDDDDYDDESDLTYFSDSMRDKVVAASTRIQAAQRGHWTRKTLAEIEALKEIADKIGSEGQYEEELNLREQKEARDVDQKLKNLYEGLDPNLKRGDDAAAAAVFADAAVAPPLLSRISRAVTSVPDWLEDNLNSILREMWLQKWWGNKYPEYSDIEDGLEDILKLSLLFPPDVSTENVNKIVAEAKKMRDDAAQAAEEEAASLAASAQEEGEDVWTPTLRCQKPEACSPKLNDIVYIEFVHTRPVTVYSPDPQHPEYISKNSVDIPTADFSDPTYWSDNPSTITKLIPYRITDTVLQESRPPDTLDVWVLTYIGPVMDGDLSKSEYGMPTTGPPHRIYRHLKKEDSSSVYHIVGEGDVIYVKDNSNTPVDLNEKGGMQLELQKGQLTNVKVYRYRIVGDQHDTWTLNLVPSPEWPAVPMVNGLPHPLPSISKNNRDIYLQTPLKNEIIQHNVEQ